MAMQTDPTVIDPQVKSVVDRILKDRLAGYGYERSDIRAGRDQDGAPILVIDVAYHPVQRAIDAKATFGIATAMRAALARLGEARFPLIRHHFDEAQKIAS